MLLEQNFTCDRLVIRVRTKFPHARRTTCYEMAPLQQLKEEVENKHTHTHTQEVNIRRTKP